MFMMESMDTLSIAIMAICMGIGLAIGLFLIAGTFYLIWRFVRAIERRESH